MTIEGGPNRVYASGITDPDEFSRLVESHWLFTNGEYKGEEGRRIIGNRLGWLEQAMTYGAEACDGTDLPFKTDDQILTEHAVLEELRTRADLDLDEQ